MEFTKFKSSDPTPSSTFDLRRELWLLTYAISSSKLVHHLCNVLSSGLCKEGDSTYTGIINATYVVYARPFHWCRGIGRLVNDDLPSESIPLHKEIIHLRDKLYAHKDVDGYKVESEIFNTVRVVVHNGAITTVPNELLPRGPKIQAIVDHVEKLIEHFTEKSIALMQKMRRPGWPQDGEYILNMDALSDEIIRPVPESEATALVKRMATAKSRRALCWALARNRMEYQFVRSCLFTICGVLPAGFLLASTWDVLPKWVTAIFAVIGGGWLIYCAIWSTYAARLMVFEHKIFIFPKFVRLFCINAVILIKKFPKVNRAI